MPSHPSHVNEAHARAHPTQCTRAHSHAHAHIIVRVHTHIHQTWIAAFFARRKAHIEMQKAKQLGNAGEAERHATICDKLEDTEDDAKEAYVLPPTSLAMNTPTRACVCVCARAPPSYLWARMRIEQLHEGVCALFD